MIISTNLHNIQDEKSEDQVGSSKFYVTPPPQSHSPSEEFATFVGESTFYDQYEHFTDIDWAANETVYGEEEEGGEEGGGFKSLEVFHLCKTHSCSYSSFIADRFKT